VLLSLTIPDMNVNGQMAAEGGSNARRYCDGTSDGNRHPATGQDTDDTACQLYSEPASTASISSIVIGDDSQPFGVGDPPALKEDNVLISETPQADEPECAAVAKLVANLGFGVILKNDHGGLAFGQCRHPRQKFVVFFAGRSIRPEHPAGPIVQGFNDQRGVVLVVKRPRRSRAGVRDDGQSHKGQCGADVE
jgi:hypothetical protein